MFWVEYTDHNGEVVKSQKKSYLKDFQIIDGEDSKQSKADFGLQIAVEEQPTVELRDWLESGLLITLFETRPKIVKEEPTEENEEPVDRVLLDGEGNPTIETINRGIVKCSFQDWLKHSPAEPKFETKGKPKSNSDGSSAAGHEGFEKHQLKYCYDKSLLTVPEFVYENKTVSLREKEIQIMQEYLVEKDAFDARIAEESKGGASAMGQNKAPPKKDAKAAGKKPADAKGDGEAVVIDYPEEQVANDLDFLILERQFDMGQEDAANVTKGVGMDKQHETVRAKIIEKYSEKARDLLTRYTIRRGSKYSLAVRFRLNMPEEIDEGSVDDGEAEEVKASREGGKRKK